MNFNYNCLVLLLGASCSYAASINLIKRPTNNNVLFDLLKELFELEKCHEETNVTDVLDATANCLNEYFPTNIDDLKNNLTMDALSQICSDSKELLKVTNCFNEFNGLLLQECTVPAEEYLKNFIKEAIENTIDTICNGTSGGLPLYRVLYTSEAIQCFERLSSNYNNECSQLQTFTSHTTSTNSILCGNLDQRYSCYSNYLAQQCPAAYNLKKFLTETSKSIKSPCPVRIPSTPKVKVTPKPIPEIRPKHSYSSNVYPINMGYHESPNPLGIFSQPSNNIVASAGAVLLPALSAAPILFIG